MAVSTLLYINRAQNIENKFYQIFFPAFDCLELLKAMLPSSNARFTKNESVVFKKNVMLYVSLCDNLRWGSLLWCSPVLAHIVTLTS